MTDFGYISHNLPIVPVQGSAIITSPSITPMPRTQCISIRGVDDASNVIVATVDANGNRSAVTLTV